VIDAADIPAALSHLRRALERWQRPVYDRSHAEDVRAERGRAAQLPARARRVPAHAPM